MRWNLSRRLKTPRSLTLFSAVLVSSFVLPAATRADEPVVPGTGRKLDRVGDDFEDEKWDFTHNFPKSSDENDKNERLPGGFSTNGRWAEGLLRGQPDVIKRVPTPPGGLEGSEGSMLLRSLHTCYPNTHTGETHQDDLLARVDSRIGSLSPSQSPSFVVRVFVPPWDKWERRNGNSFGFRIACSTTKTVTKRRNSGGFGRFLNGGSSTSTEVEPYWPGMLIYFHPGDGKERKDYATIRIRANRLGGDFNVLDIKEPGWWTLGMSVTPDGQVHYYARQGVEDLTAKDHLTSQFPYGFRAERVKTFFFNVLNGDNGKWSTTWIVDDPSVYVAR